MKGDLEQSTELLAIVIEPFPDHATVPATTLGMTYAVLGGLLSGKGDDDLRLYDARRRHADFVRRAHRLMADTAPSRLSRLITDERRRLAEANEPLVSMLRIARAARPYDYISRDFDYSPERIASLIEQGAAAAEAALAPMEKQDQKLALV